jgi:hypothetical protein
MTVWLNAAPAGLIEVAGEPAAVSLVVEDGQVTRGLPDPEPAKADAAQRTGRPRQVSKEKGDYLLLSTFNL